jgi:osmotically-inducible protein OsmY
MRDDAVRLSWRAGGVKEVINRVQVTNQGGIVDYARDSWVTSQLVGKLLLDENVQSINYNVKTVGGVVYLMGIAQNRAELERVTNHARNLSYVRKVESFVRLKDDPRRHKS